MCKLSLMAQASGSHVDKPRAVAEEILTHKWHGVSYALFLILVDPTLWSFEELFVPLMRVELAAPLS